MDDWRKWKPTNTPGAEEAEKKALEACQAALEAEKHANAAQKAAQEGKVELAQQEAQAAKELATKAQKRAEAAEQQAAEEEEGEVELAEQEAQAAKALATKAQKRAEAAEKASIAHGNPATPKPDLNKDNRRAAHDKARVAKKDAVLASHHVEIRMASVKLQMKDLTNMLNDPEDWATHKALRIGLECPELPKPEAPQCMLSNEQGAFLFIGAGSTIGLAILAMLVLVLIRKLMGQRAMGNSNSEIAQAIEIDTQGNSNTEIAQAIEIDSQK